MNIYGSICGHSCLKPKYATKQLYGIYERFVKESIEENWQIMQLSNCQSDIPF